MNKKTRHASLIMSMAGALFFTTSTTFAGCEDEPHGDLANALYKGIEDQSVQLKDGHWEGEPFVEGGASRPAVGLAEGFSLHGDLDGDGADEAVVLLWQSSGGSGTFDYLAAMKEEEGKWMNVATAPLGDRVQVRSGSIESGIVSLNVVQQGEDDAACCPSQLAGRSWGFEDGQLKEQEPRMDGKLTVAALEGTEWALTRLKAGHDLPENTEVTLAFSEGQVAGNSGCNRYSASVENGAAPGELRIGPAMGTRMACPEAQMNIESEFLGLLSHAEAYRFVAGRLVLTGNHDGERFTLKFKARK